MLKSLLQSNIDPHRLGIPRADAKTVTKIPSYNYKDISDLRISDLRIINLIRKGLLVLVYYQKTNN